MIYLSLNQIIYLHTIFKEVEGVDVIEFDKILYLFPISKGAEGVDMLEFKLTQIGGSRESTMDSIRDIY